MAGINDVTKNPFKTISNPGSALPNMNLPVPSFFSPMFDPSRGSGWNPSQANIQQPFDAAGAQAVQAQNQSGIAQQQNFVNALNQQNGIGNLQSVFNQQQGLAGQLQQQAAGGGPNPALAQLNQTTNQNMANQAQLMASQRGVNQNPGLLAQHIASQGANIQQQAAAQAATMRANQQLGAQQQLAGIQNQMGGIANSQIGAQQQALGALQNYGLGNQGQYYGGMSAQNAANVGMTGNQNTTSAGIAQGNQASQAGVVGGVMQGIGSATNLIPKPFAHGGQVSKKMADGGMADYTGGAASAMGQWLTGGAPQNPFASKIYDSMSAFGKSGDKKPAAPGAASGVAPDVAGTSGGIDTLMEVAPDVALANKGGQIKGVGSKLKSGGKVPGKAKVSGDSLKNDVVNAKLSPGEIVIPRSVLNSQDPAGNAAKFVAAVLAKNGMKGK